MKDNFLLKKSYQKIFNELSDDEAGKLIKGIFSYVNTQENNLDGLLSAVFIQIKDYIDSNEEKYRKICERNRKNGLEGGRPRGKPNETQINPVGYFGKNTHISYIHNNHLEDKKDSNRGMGEEKEKEETFKATEDIGLLMEIAEKIINHLNVKTKSNYKFKNESTLEKIKAQLNEGYKLEDFIDVIDKKSDEWIGTEFEQHLCPDVLFGKKFEKYLNQKIKPKKEEPKCFKEDINQEKLSQEELEEVENLLKEFK